MQPLDASLTTFYLLVVAHFLADFVFQGSLALKKKGFNKYMLAHAAMMGLAFFLPLINYPAGRTVLAAGILFILHIIIDAVRVETNKALKLLPGTWGGSVSLGIDQILHVSIIYLLFRFLVLG
jgi:hypothetical protein